MKQRRAGSLVLVIGLAFSLLAGQSTAASSGRLEPEPPSNNLELSKLVAELQQKDLPQGEMASDAAFSSFEKEFGSLEKFNELAKPIRSRSSATSELVSEEAMLRLEAAMTEQAEPEGPSLVTDWTDRTPNKSDVAELLGEARELGKTKAIVGFRVRHTGEGVLSEKALDAQRDEITRLASGVERSVSETGGVVIERWETMPILVVEVDEVGVKALAEHPDIAFAQSKNVEAELTLDETVDIVETDHRDYGPGNNSAGEGQIVAVIDTGVDATHSALLRPDGSSSAPYSMCFFSMGAPTAPGANTTACPDGNLSQLSVGPAAGMPCSGDCDHGTHVAGIAVGDDPNDVHDGVAPAADVFPIRIGNVQWLWFADGVDFLRAFSWVDLFASAGHPIAAVNGSFEMSMQSGETCSSNFLTPVLNNLLSNDVLPVISTGNDGQLDEVGYPACMPQAMSVGATSNGDEVADFSNNSAASEIFAPGVDVHAPIPNEGWAELSGTSMAAPHVSGAAAALKNQLYDNSATSIWSRLRSTGYLVDDQRTGGNWTHPRLRVAPSATPWMFLANRGGTASVEGSFGSSGSTGLIHVADGVYLFGGRGVFSAEERSTMLVTPVGKLTRYCSVNEVPFFSGVAGLVACTDGKGRLRDSDFDVQVVRDPISEADPNPNRRSASVYQSTPSATGAVIPTQLNINSTGNDNVVYKGGTGQHLVLFNGIRYESDQIVQVSINDIHNFGRCTTGGAGSFFLTAATVVTCFDAQGNPADRAFTATLTTRSGSFPGSRYVAQTDSAVGSSAPAVQSSMVTGPAPTSVWHWSTGTYIVVFDEWPNTEVKRSHAVTTIGTDRWCQSMYTYESMVVRCTDSNGQPADSRFSVMAVADNHGYN